MIRAVSFGECDLIELYRILELRSSVFGVEQQAIYNDLDGRDLDALMLWVEEQGAVVACLRLLPPSRSRPLRPREPWVISRVATRPEARGRGLAGSLIDEALRRVPRGEPVAINAQARLEAWYAGWGFARSGPDVWEDGIRHVPMIRNGV